MMKDLLPRIKSKFKNQDLPVCLFKGFNRGIPQFESSLIKGAVTPGPLVVYPKGGSNNPYFSYHEPGHVVQYILLGPSVYAFGVAIPSLLSSGSKNHEQMPWEMTANQLWYWLTGETDKSNQLYIK